MRQSGHFPLRIKLLALLVVAALSSTTTARGQYPESPTTFKFPGGTLREYVDRTKEVFGNDVQVIVAPEIEDATIEPIEFKARSPNPVVELLGHLAQGQCDVELLYGVWLISPPLSKTQVFSVREFIANSGQSRDDAMKALLSATEAALAIGSHSIPAVRIKLHPDTGLLLASGTPEQIVIIQQVVSQLSGAIGQSRASVNDLRARLQQLEQELRALEEHQTK